MKREGFTLVELVAVIGLLGLLMLVSFQLIIKQINKSQDRISEAEETLIFSAVESYINNYVTDYPKVVNNVFCIDLNEVKSYEDFPVDMIDINTREKFLDKTNLTIKAVVDSDYNYNMEFNEYCVPYTAEKTYVDASGASRPELIEKMIPIVWDEFLTTNSKWVKASITSDWYDYSDKEWANAVIIDDAHLDSYISAPAGTSINEDHVRGYFVWIPRFKYRLFNTEYLERGASEVDVMFESNTNLKEKGDENSEWLTHPAFEKTNSLNGFWVSKYQATTNISSPIFKPNELIVTTSNLKNMFTSANDYYQSSINDYKSYIPNNLMWGAISYLQMSSFGSNSKVLPNPSNTTGCGGNIIPGNYTCNYAYYTSEGLITSTTGNIYGIYDTSGGSYEYVAAFSKNSSGDIILNTSGYNLTDVGDTDIIKYFDIYDYNTNESNYNISKLGDSSGETNNWHDSSTIMPTSTKPFILRGGTNVSTLKQGIFSINNYGANGSDLHDPTYRIVISK